MRLIKMFGLAAIAVGAFIAFLGVTSASAVTSLEEVVLCKHKEDPCLNGSFGTGTVAHIDLVSGTVGKLDEGSLGKILCATAHAKAKTNEALAHGLIEELKLVSCVRDKILGGTESCSVSEENLPYLGVFLLAPDHQKYHLVLSNHGSGNPQVHMTCGGVTNCTFGASEILFEVLLDEVNRDVVLDVSQELERSGGICPSISTWTAEYLMRCLEGTTFVSCWPKMENGSILTTP